jgi:aminoglycoside 3-N-acetyltransferase
MFIPESAPMVEKSGATVLEATSGILYVRAALRPLARPIKAAGGVLPFLHERINFRELLVPHFYGARPFWRGRPESWPRTTNSGSLGKQIVAIPQAVLSQHPTHAFAGLGNSVAKSLRAHDGRTACFAPIGELADRYDFSMLLLGCVDDSPGFSTVHVAQHRLGLSQRHLLRLLLRWDEQIEGRTVSRMAPESPGCSTSFDKFYPYYEADGNLVRGEWFGVPWLYVTSARRALLIETGVLRERGRFVDCGRWSCLSCRLRLY